MTGPSRMLLRWRLYGLPRCSGISDGSDHCWRLIWPWQDRELAANGAPIHVRCLRPLRIPRLQFWFEVFRHGYVRAAWTWWRRNER